MTNCEKCNCDSTDVDIYKIPAYEETDESNIILCPPCACEFGFCVMCGWFVAGTENENWNNTGLCFDCCQELDDIGFYEDTLGH